MIYILDTSVLVEASRRKYPFDVFPSFWAAILSKMLSKEVIICKNVYDELEKSDDELFKWIKAHRCDIFVESPASRPIAKAEADLLAFYSSADSPFESHVVNEFAAAADSWLIAHAKKWRL